ARLSFHQSFLSPVFSLGSDYFTLSDETTESRPSRKNVPVILWVQQFRYRRLPCAQRRETLYSQAPSSTAMKLILDEEAREGAIRVDRAWELFFETKSGIPEGHGARLIPFTNWLWDEL